MGVTLNQSCCYGYQSPDVSIFLKLVVYLALPSAVWAKFWASTANIKCIVVLQTLDSLEMKANFNTVLPYVSLHIRLSCLYCNFNCLNMLLWSSLIQITQIQLSNNSHFRVINWKPHIEIFPRRPPCIYTIWPTEVKSYNSCTAITHFLTLRTHTLQKITVRIIHLRWYRPTPLAHGLYVTGHRQLQRHRCFTSGLMSIEVPFISRGNSFHMETRYIQNDCDHISHSEMTKVLPEEILCYSEHIGWGIHNNNTVYVYLDR